MKTSPEINTASREIYLDPKDLDFALSGQSQLLRIFWWFRGTDLVRALTGMAYTAHALNAQRQVKKFEAGLKRS